MTLLVHDGELSDLRPLLGDLGTPFVDRIGELSTDDRDAAWDLVIANPKRILSLKLHSAAPPVQIVVLDQDSKTLRNTLRRAGIKLIVRRPVHPAALRAMILHCLYRGPEKRRTVRVSVGAPVRFRMGWRMRSAILADLSLGGCRLLTEHRAERGKSFTLHLPAELAGGKSLSLKGRVLRTAAAEDEAPGTLVLTARFDPMKDRLQECLKVAVRAHASGPAVFGTRAKPCAAEAPDAACEAPAPRAAPVLEAAEGDRREDARHALDRRVIALADEATRVLMGSDISVGGMRVKANPLLKLGDDLRIAIHVGDRDLPLVIRAKVHRDDGEAGIVLRFHQPDAETSRYLNEMVDVLPLVDTDEGDSGYLVTEILEESA